MEQTNKDCRFEILILINSPLQQHLLVGRKDSRLRYVLVHNVLRKLCYGSKKWRWLNQWMIWNLRVLWEEFEGQDFEVLDAKIASALNRIIQNTRFKKKISLEEMKAQKKDRFIFRNSIQSGMILENLYKLRIRESEKLKTVLELYNMEIHQKKAGPDYHRLKTMVKRSIEQEFKNDRNLRARNGNYERNAVVKNQSDKTAWTKKSRRLLAMES